MLKRCITCEEHKPATPEYFQRDNSKPDGLNAKCKVCANRYSREYAHNNPEKSYRFTHPEQAKQFSINWKKANPQKVWQATSRWNKKNADKVVARVQRRRAQMIGNGGSYTAEEWDALCAHYDYRCLCCKEQKPLTVDHVIPISKGGSNNIDNIQPLCQECNSRKWDKVIDYRTSKPLSPPQTASI